MKILRVGDPHVKVSNLDESERLMQFVLAMARAHNVDTIELLGDLFHTHAILRLEVLLFWQKWLYKLSKEFYTIVLVGNHDQSGDHSSDSNVLTVLSDLNPDSLLVVELPALVKGIGYLPYIHDNEKFIKEANILAELGATCLVSHTTYQGSKYDNGMYAPDGVDPDAISGNFVNLISGHVHTEQEYGRVWYPGTARWDTASDANKRKGVWICVHDNGGRLTSREFVSTGEGVCVPIISVEWREGEACPELPEGAKTQVELIGSSAWVAKEKINLKGKASIKTKITDTKKESRKAGSNLLDFVNNHFESKMKDKVVNKMKELGLV
jgi:DNA repair exonuclease SbcCD nuclease subunit